MDFSLYQKFIDDLAEFPVPLKVLHFAGLGEPLLHPRIADMVRYAKEKNIAQTVDIVSNGALLKDG
ncbi:radical SAM protein, partial [Selenomonas sp.]